jgi:hypothetical protein
MREKGKSRFCAGRIQKNFTCVPVLIHVNGVSSELVDSDYFYRIIDFTELLKK